MRVPDPVIFCVPDFANMVSKSANYCESRWCAATVSFLTRRWFYPLDHHRLDKPDEQHRSDTHLPSQSAAWLHLTVTFRTVLCRWCCVALCCAAGLLLLCEVALGTPRQLKQSDYYASNLPAGRHSTHGMGRTGPDPTQTMTLEDGVKVPLGQHQNTNVNGTCTLHAYNL